MLTVGQWREGRWVPHYGRGYQALRCETERQAARWIYEHYGAFPSARRLVIRNLKLEN